MFPLKNYNYDIPIEGPNSFGAIRKFDIHTGVDLFCEDGETVFAIESGIIVDIVKFTGFEESPWWNDTYAMVIKSISGYILYGEITPLPTLKIDQQIQEGDMIGNIKQVLKEDKGKPMSMLHMELYSLYHNPVWWNHNFDKPIGLENITNILEFNLKNNYL
jgi:hypothetical protein